MLLECLTVVSFEGALPVFGFKAAEVKNEDIS